MIYNLVMSHAHYDHFKHARKSIRYDNWDYRTPGFYFITICTQGRQPFFDNSEFKAVVEYAWSQLASLPHIVLDAHIVMFDHIHCIICITRFFSAEQTTPEPSSDFRHAPAGSIGAIVGSFKGTTTERINKLRNAQGNKVWQRGYWDRIIRNERELNAIRQYIHTNPQRHADRRDNLDTLINTRMTYHP